MIRVNFKPLGVPTFGHSLKMGPEAAEAISAGGNILSSVINGIFSHNENVKQRNFARELYLRQYQDSVNEWYRQAEYNSPVNQKRLLEEAGLNPNLLMGNMSNVGSVDSTQMPHANGSYSPVVPHFGNPVAELAQIGLAQAQIEKTKAEANAITTGVDIDKEMMYARLRQMGVDYNLTDQLLQYNKSYMPKALYGKDLENKSAELNIDLVKVYKDGQEIMNQINSENLKVLKANNVYLDERAALNIAKDRQELENMVLQSKYTVAATCNMFASAVANRASANLSDAQRHSIEYDTDLKQRSEVYYMTSLGNDLQSQAYDLGMKDLAFKIQKRMEYWNKVFNTTPYDDMSDRPNPKHNAGVKEAELKKELQSWSDAISPYIQGASSFVKPGTRVNNISNKTWNY